MTSIDGDAKPLRDWTASSVNERHVRHLQYVTQQSFVQEYKQLNYDLLGLEPGCHVLDVGCGLGNDAVALAAQVLPDGRVTGIDHSETMIQQARERHADSPLPVEFLLTDATHMHFADNTFDVARSDRVLQHIPAVRDAVAEIVRVVKPGGRIVCSETDWDSLMLDVTDRSIFRRIKDYNADKGIRNGWMGRQIYGYLVELGVQNLSVVASNGIFTDYAFMQQWGVWHAAVDNARVAGIISDEEAASHLADIDERVERGQHLFGLTILTTSGINA